MDLGAFMDLACLAQPGLHVVDQLPALGPELVRSREEVMHDLRVRHQVVLAQRLLLGVALSADLAEQE